MDEVDAEDCEWTPDNEGKPEEKGDLVAEDSAAVSLPLKRREPSFSLPPVVACEYCDELLYNRHGGGRIGANSLLCNFK